MTKKYRDTYALISAICLAIYCIKSIFNVAQHAAVIGHYDFNYNDILWWVGFCGLSLLIYGERRNIGLVIFSGVICYEQLYTFVNNIGGAKLYDFLCILAYVLLVVLFVIYIIPGLSNMTNVVGIMSYAPAVLLLASNILLWIQWISWKIFTIESLISSVLFALILVLGFFFAGKWVYNTTP